ncbi:MAG: UvrB/UvrC motif-containing protein [Phycisphaerae bacterium]|nr:UvrB/UvrC motif-containing protein [Phycisphaerae bacterium]
MDLDISDILKRWPFKPGEVNVRRIIGADGREKLQLRLDLGLLQMEVVGRPDGKKPKGHETLLDYYESKLQEHKNANGATEGFTITAKACEKLRAEGVMFYHRYLAAFVLGDYESVVRDTRRNLRLFDFCTAYAKTENDRLILEQFRPYVVMMHARARCREALKNKRPKQALVFARQGIEAIREFLEQNEMAIENSPELGVLYNMEREVIATIPVDPAVKLKQKLQTAIEEERYEEAAAIRDEMSKKTKNDQ